MKTKTMAALKITLSFLLVLVSWTSTHASTLDKRESENLQNSIYSVEQVVVGGATEFRFKLNNRHFATLIDQGGTYAFRPHPGCDINGWGSTWYAQPFLPGAALKHTVIGAANADSNGIHLKAQGMVSRGLSDTYGTWSSLFDYIYNPARQVITGTGQYTITLAGPLSSATGELNLYKTASNYLHNVPLLSGGIGDTGDMKQANAGGNGFSFTWVPPDQPAHFPTDKTDSLSIELIGQFNSVDTQALGYAPIAPAFKPGLKVVLTSLQVNTGIMFGAFYNLAENKCYFCDNVGITPLISQTSTNTEFRFNVLVESPALETCAYLPVILKP